MPRRIVELDALRGLMLVWITGTHLPTILSTFVNQAFGFFAATHGQNCREATRESQRIASPGAAPNPRWLRTGTGDEECGSRGCGKSDVSRPHRPFKGEGQSFAFAHLRWPS